AFDSRRVWPAEHGVALRALRRRRRWVATGAAAVADVAGAHLLIVGAGGADRLCWTAGARAGTEQAYVAFADHGAALVAGWLEEIGGTLRAAAGAELGDVTGPGNRPAFAGARR